MRAASIAAVKISFVPVGPVSFTRISRSQDDLVKITFVLGITLIFIPVDMMLEISSDTGVLVYTALIIGLLIWLHQRAKQADKSLPLTSASPSYLAGTWPFKYLGRPMN